MARIRLLFLISTLAIVGIVGYIVSLFAKGYQFDTKKLEFSPSGILVIKSNPDGAQVFINGELKTATNTTINVAPGTYDISIKKDGYGQWNKRLTIEKEVVTEADAHLFRVAPSLSAVTFSGATTPIPSPDLTKIAYIVEASPTNQDQAGLWIVETVNLPLGFSREPRRITDGDLSKSQFTWSPDGREILLKNPLGAFLLDAGTFTAQSQRTNILALEQATLDEWKETEAKRLEAKIASVPDELKDLLTRKTSAVVFSPDESKILYTATAAATIKPEIIRPVPGASSQRQEREVAAGKTYVYDLKEDRNFAVDGDNKTLSIESWKFTTASRRMFWFSSSRHLVLSEKDKVVVMDMDGTNHQTVYSGSYVAPYTLAAPSLDRLLILTNLGANSNPANIYSLGLK